VIAQYRHTIRLPLPVITRWSSHSVAINAVIRLKNCLQQSIWSASLKQLSGYPAILQTMQSEVFWDKLLDIQLILDPLRNAITAIEGDIVKLSYGFKKLEAAFDEITQAIITSKFSRYDQDWLLSVFKLLSKFVEYDII
jgi:hypothetical protein